MLAGLQITNEKWLMHAKVLFLDWIKEWHTSFLKHLHIKES